MQKHVNLVDLVKSFPTHILLQNLASIQKRTSPIKFAHLAEKSENASTSNLSTKAAAAGDEVRAVDEVQQERDHRRALVDLDLLRPALRVFERSLRSEHGGQDRRGTAEDERMALHLFASGHDDTHIGEVHVFAAPLPDLGDL